MVEVKEESPRIKGTMTIRKRKVTLSFEKNSVRRWFQYKYKNKSNKKE